MKQKIIDFIAENYWDNRVFEAPRCIKAEEKLYRKYIRPEIEKNRAVGDDIEACYLEAVSAWGAAAFKEGFKAGTAMMAECL